MGEILSRRGFIAGSAAAVGAGALLAGAASAVADEASSTVPETWDYACDFLVVGYGGAGLWGCLCGADECAMEVVALEKAPERGGGNTSINMGEFTVVTDKEGFVQYMQGFSQGLIPEAICRAWAEEASRNVEYMNRYGIEPVDLGGSMASGFTRCCEYPEFDPNQPDGWSMGIYRYSWDYNGAFGWELLDKARADLGVEVKFDCHDEELILDPTTREVLGAYFYQGDDGKRYAIKARKGVLLSTGGFEFDEQMQKEHLKCYPARGMYGWPFNTGDGHKMAFTVGAASWGMREMIGADTTNFPNNPYKYAISARPHGDNYLDVTRTGKRWHNEKGGFDPHNGWHPYMNWDEKICDFDRIPTWIIFDQKGLDGGPLGPSADSGSMQMNLKGLPASCGAYGGWSDDNSWELEHGWIKQGNTLDELAAAMADPDAFVDDRMDVETLKATIERWNEMVANGVDEEFGRDLSGLEPLEPPFYAMPKYPGGCTTLGGPKKNEHAQILDGAGNPIPRLYGAGSMCNCHNHTYGISGGGNAENMVFGRIAARHAAELEAWDA